MSLKPLSESAKLFNAESLLQTRESEYCQSGTESKVGPDQWVCIWLPEETDKHRNFNCSQYDTCLEEAAAKQWDGFTCSECSKFKEKGELNAK